MDYKNKYNDALERARKEYKTHESFNGFREMLLYIFPELKDSDDNEIRESIIGFLITISSLKDGMTLSNEDFDSKTILEWLAWLEKQGEQKSTDKIQIGKEYKCTASPRYSTFMRGEIYKPEDKFLCSFMNFCSDCFEPIEDSEPKFKVGD